MLTAGRSPATASFGLVLLHGRGAGALDIVGLGDALALPDLAMIAPEAPGRSWWPTSFLAPAAQIEPAVQQGIAQVDAAIANFTTQGLPVSRIGLLGFSQGGCLAAEYLARKGAGLGVGVILSAGVIGTADADSGSNPALYGFGDKTMEYQTNLSALTVFMSCHASDPHIPHKRFFDTVGILRDCGAAVSDRTKPGQGHGIDDADLAGVRRLLNVAAE